MLLCSYNKMAGAPILKRAAFEKIFYKLLVDLSLLASLWWYWCLNSLCDCFALYTLIVVEIWVYKIRKIRLSVNGQPH